MELSNDVPENVREILEVGGIFVPSQGIADEAMIVYQRMLAGQCMHCESEIGEYACLIVNHLGVVMIFCGQPCLQDWHNMHWMMEQYDDFKSAAEFRNAASKGHHDG